MDSFKDPFEFRAKISLDAPEQIKTKMAIEKICQKHPNVTQEEARKLAPAFLAECERNGPDRVKQNVLKNYGIVSLAGTLQNILMWSHYADGHNGVCIEFCYANNTHLDFFARALLVDYYDKLPTLKGIQYSTMLSISKSVKKELYDLRKVKQYIEEIIE